MESSLRMRQGKGNAIHCPRHSDWQAGYPYTTSQLGSHPGILAEILAGILAGELQQVAHSERIPHTPARNKIRNPWQGPQVSEKE